MADSTTHYGLTTGVVADDLIEPGSHNRIADTLDRVLGWFLKRMMADGVYEGWDLALDGTVTAGEGLVNGCWCMTMGSQAIEDLTADAINYVFVGNDLTSAPAGTARFFATLSGTKPPGAALLGSMSIDAQGDVTAVDQNFVGVDRNCRRLEIDLVSGSESVAEVAAGATVTVTVTHETEFVVPGAITFNSDSEGFSWELRETHRSDGFCLLVTNNNVMTANFSGNWQRSGLVA